jgi:2-polyprenyl-6-methoxyphenol hydroxylase-like FAD-dependent oxidoreductase
MNTQVLIVGAGPTGLMAANQLQRFGIDCLVIDSKSGPTIESRAIAVTARSLEIYQQLGLSNEVVNDGVQLISLNAYSDGKKKAEVKLGEIGKGMSDFPYVLAYEQSKNETLLYENLKKNNGNVEWQTEFISLEQHKESISAVVMHNNETYTINAQYIVGCDGARSPIRNQLNFKFDGGTYENKFFVADVIMEWELSDDKIIIAPSDENFCGFFPLANDKEYRVLGSLPKKYFNEENISFDDIKNVIISTIGKPIHFEKTNWFSVYKLHHRCVDNFSSGNVFLVGDSAHIHSPAGGQGMNTGLQDAYNLSWKLAAVLQGYAKKELLLTYNEERLPFAQWLLKFTDRMFSIMTSGNWFIAIFRKYVVLNLMSVIFSIEAIRPTIFKTMSQIWYSYSGMELSYSTTKQKLKFKAGDRLPYIIVSSSEKPFYESFTAPSFHLLYLSNDLLDTETKNEIANTIPFSVKIIEYPITESWKKLGVNTVLYILVRPDNYIAYLSDSFNKTEVKKYLNRFFNLK